MFIRKLTLQHFRKFTKNTLTFSSSTSILLGPNASGKTSMLEAIFLLSLGKSFRAEKESEVVSFEKEVARAKGEIEDNQIDISIRQKKEEVQELEIVLTTGIVHNTKVPIKRYLVNGVSRRAIDFSGKLKVVLFWPQDLELVTDSPSLRRRYLDFVLMQVDWEYRRTLLSYERGLRQRNRLLEAIREQQAGRHELLFWDQLLIKHGGYITKKREEYIYYVNHYQTANRYDTSDSLTDKQLSNYQLVYDASFITRARLDQYVEAEVASGVTLVGPHRDDVEFRIKSQETSIKSDEWKSLSRFGSRGEQRLAVLWFKLAELSFIESISGERPILLLDDILSELDHEHRKIIFSLLGRQQTIITTTDRHFIEHNKTLSSLEIIPIPDV